MKRNIAIVSLALLIVCVSIVIARPQQSNTPSERLFDLSSLFNRYPSYQRPYYGGGGGGFQQGPFYQNPGIGQGGFSSYGGYAGSGGYPGSGGTNVLASSGFPGGFGGYGGYGGNGGLQSYNGYNNNNYNGQRNVGFGYYRGTDSNGFVPSRDLNFYSGTGYRGYN